MAVLVVVRLLVRLNRLRLCVVSLVGRHASLTTPQVGTALPSQLPRTGHMPLRCLVLTIWLSVFYQNDSE